MTVTSSDAVVVLVTVGSPAQADRIADAVVGEQLAACVNVVGPVRSIYRWENRVQRDEELLLVIKTRAALLPDLETRVKALHSYETPEVVALPITAGSQAYLEWLQRVTRAPQDD